LKKENKEENNFKTLKSRVLSVKKSKDHVLFTGTVLIPGEPDCDYENGEEILTPEKVAKMAHEYLLNYRLVDKDHNFFQTHKTVGAPVESYLLPEPRVMKNIEGVEREYPAGTWVVKSMITDPELMEKAEKGQIAYSVTALSKKDAEKLHAARKDRVLIKDLEDPIGFTVSLVENPCVDNSCSVKNDSVVMKEGRAISKQNRNVLEKARDLINELINQSKQLDADNGGNTMAEKEKNENAKPENSEEKSEYVSKSEFLEFKKQVLKAIKNGKSEEGSEEEGGDPEKSKKSKESTEPSSKALKNHDTKKEVSFKSVEYYMGRSKRGRPLKKKME
jgi:hypothetical protein